MKTLLTIILLLLYVPVYADPVINSVVRNGSYIDITWSDSEFPPDGGYDLIVDGSDPGTWRQDKHTYYRFPIEPEDPVAHCFEVEGRHVGENRFVRSAVACEMERNRGRGWALLSWNEPTKREDGTLLGEDLDHYRVYFGIESQNLNHILVLPCDSYTNFTVHNLESGNWYFAVTAVDTQMNESQLSNTETKLIGSRPQSGTMSINQ